MKTGETYTLYTGGTITGITELNSRISKGGTISDGSSVLEYTQTDVTYSDIKGGFGPGGNGHPNGGNRPGGDKFNPDDNSGDFTPPDMSDDERPSMPSMPDGTRPENLTITVHVLKPPVRLPEFHKIRPLFMLSLTEVFFVLYFHLFSK